MVGETPHIHPYYVERQGEVIPVSKHVEKGRQFIRGLNYLLSGLSGIDDIDVRFVAISWEGRIVINPSKPVERKVVRGDTFYEYTSPNEITFSAKQLVVKSFELVDFRNLTFKTESPVYTKADGKFPLMELATLNLTEHDISIVPEG